MTPAPRTNAASSPKPSAATTRQLNTTRHMLAQWAAFAEQYWYSLPQRPDLGCFGTGYNSWGVQTNQKYIGTVAVLALDEAAQPAIAKAGLTPQHLLNRALAALRYEIETHHVGSVKRTDGSQWGHTWISGLGIERMMHAVDALWPHMTQADRQGFLSVLAGEADWLLNHYTVGAFPWAQLGPNHPESNLWNGGIMLRAAMMMPGHDHADKWTHKAHAFLLNSISVPRDAHSDQQFLGRPLNQWYVGDANFFPNFALDHHTYLNVGYMAICLSNVAMLHYAYALRGRLAPPAVYHHARDLWQLVRSLVFADGRLARIGGDSRTRYCYCQDYLLPTLVFAADYFADPLAPHFEAGQIKLLKTEQRHNGPGSFLRHRIKPLMDASTYYYTRLEADKAVCLAMQLHWRNMRPALPAPQEMPPADVEPLLARQWHEPQHSAIFLRQPTRLASVSWRACEGAQVMCLPPDDGSLAEWTENLAGRTSPLGELTRGNSQAVHPVLRATETPFNGGFVTCGTTFDGTWIDLPEGYRTRNLVRHHLAVAALPDGHSIIRMELARLAPQRAFFRDRRGFKLNLPTDIFNRSPRKLHTAGGSRTLRPRMNGRESLTSLASPYFNVDDRIAGIAVFGDDSFQLYRPGKRRGGLGGSLYYDEICLQATLDQFDASAGDNLLDNGAAIMASISHQQTARLAEAAEFGLVQCRPTSDDPQTAAIISDCRGMWFKALDGHTYLFVANFFLDEADTLPPADETPAAAVPAARAQPMAPDNSYLRHSTAQATLDVTLPPTSKFTRAIDLTTNHRHPITAPTLTMTTTHTTATHTTATQTMTPTLTMTTTPGTARIFRLE